MSSRHSASAVVSQPGRTVPSGRCTSGSSLGSKLAHIPGYFNRSIIIGCLDELWGATSSVTVQYALQHSQANNGQQSPLTQLAHADTTRQLPHRRRRHRNDPQQIDGPRAPPAEAIPTGDRQGRDRGSCGAH